MVGQDFQDLVFFFSGQLYLVVVMEAILGSSTVTAWNLRNIY